MIGRNWGLAPAFVDFSHVSPALRSENGEHLVALIGRAATRSGIKPIVTVSLHRDSAFQAAAREVVRTQKLGVAIRLHFGDLDKDTTSDDLESLRSGLGVSYSEADLFVECGVAGETSPDYDWLSSRIPRLWDWRRLIVTSGSFPRNLEGMAVGMRAEPRHDWLHWQAWATSPRSRDARVPDFSDYTIQHAVFSEPPVGSNPSASIRYASEAYWLIARGEALQNRNEKAKGAGHRQYYGNAQLLSERDEFKGPTFSFGDRYISAAANRRGGPGTPTTWLTAGMNHHMTLAARQVWEAGR